jgi:hypothetical protein
MNMSEKQRAATGPHPSRGPFCRAVLLALLVILPTGARAAQIEGGILQREISARYDLINVKLLGVTEYALTELFNDVLERAPGVVEARRYRFRMEPSRPAACIVEWAVRIRDTDPFRLQRYIDEMMRAAIHPEVGVAKRSTTQRPRMGRPEQMGEIRPWRASAKEIQFVLDHKRSPTPTGGTGPAERAAYWRGVSGAGFE